VGESNFWSYFLAKGKGICKILATMCGIVGYVGKKEATPIILEGLRRLEYRGYDSAGVAVLGPSGKLEVVKKAGRVVDLAKRLLLKSPAGSVGIGHTRWATHGGVTDVNAHPHLSSDGRVAIVHNGVIENYLTLKKFLLKEGFEFASQTDTEVLANLIAYHLARSPLAKDKNQLVESVRLSLAQVEGTYGLVVLSRDFPGEMVVARKSSPLVIGVGAGEYVVASDMAAFSGLAAHISYLDDGQLAHLTRESFTVMTLGEEAVTPQLKKIDWKTERAEMGDFASFMEKEIYEQPMALENAFRGRISADKSTAQFGGLNMTPRDLRGVDRIMMVGCGTAWHACQMGKYLFERYARVPVEVDYGSEFRYRNAPVDKNTLVIVVSQSGETIDTLEALREAKRRGLQTLAITNGVGSSIAREVDGGIYQHAGPEIGVASTKAFTTQLLILALLALYLGRMRGMSVSDGAALVKAIEELPALVQKSLKKAPEVKLIAQKFAKAKDFLFLGRQEMFPIALEGALKLKEISYIHAEGFPAAEMKHGVIALVCPKCPTVVLVQEGNIAQKTLSNLQEIRARGGPVIAVVHESVRLPASLTDSVIRIPATHPALFPILATIPLQLLAYFMAEHLGRDVDKPRNLAKSVTVE
jgi:glutamine---fructose-6-phosphate transaminase (isomerizing)